MAGEMSAEELASMRREGGEHGLSRRETIMLLAHVDAITAQRDEAQRVLCMIAPEPDVVPPRLECGGPTKAGRDAAGRIITSAVRVLFMEMETHPPEKRNRLTIGVITHDGEGQKYNLTLAKDEWESVMETQRDAARRERDALVVERDAADARADAVARERDEARAKLRALVESCDVAMANGYETSHGTRDALDEARAVGQARLEGGE